jgi:hypothetical protein
MTLISEQMLTHFVVKVLELVLGVEMTLYYGVMA